MRKYVLLLTALLLSASAYAAPTSPQSWNGSPISPSANNPMPEASGGTNNSTALTQGSVVFKGATGYTQDNASLNFNDSADTLTAKNLALTNALGVPYGGTGGTTAAEALDNLGGLSNSSDVQAFTTSGTWTAPTSFTPKMCHFIMFSGGGSGGGGGMATLGNVASGGGGGGAGQRLDYWVPYALMTSPTTVTVAESVAGGKGATVNGAGADGNAGQATTFGTLLKVWGGGRGGGGQAAAASGGGGGAGPAGNGGDATGTTAGAAGAFAGAGGSAAIGGQSGTASGQLCGGAGGGGASTSAAFSGGASVCITGGGSGGTLLAATSVAGAAGGYFQPVGAIGGAASSGGANGGGTGGNAVANAIYHLGSGSGAGGGANTDGAGGNGGGYGVATYGCAGGGGGAGTTRGGDGGAGCPGYVEVRCY